MWITTIICYDMLPLQGEYKLWIYHNYMYIVSLLRSHLSGDEAITKMENLTARHLKNDLVFQEVLLMQSCTAQVYAALAFFKCLDRQN